MPWNEILYAVGGYVLTVVARRLGLPVPGLELPKPVLPDPGAPDRVLVDALQHVLKARAGEIKLDNMDLEVLRALDPVIHAVLEKPK